MIFFSSSPKHNMWLLDQNEMKKEDVENVSTSSSYSLFPTSNWMTTINTKSENTNLNEAMSASGNWPLVPFPQQSNLAVIPTSSSEISQTIFSEEKETSPLAKLLQDQRSKSHNKP